MGYTFVSGHIALDLVGTVSHRSAPDRYEILSDPAILARWVGDAELLDAPPSVDQAELERTRTLREAIYRLARARLDDTPADSEDLDLLNRDAEPPPVTVRLDERGALSRRGDMGSVRSSIARSAIELLGGAGAANLKACEAAPCSRLYLDGSRRNSRRWCDMRECGNRAKATAYRRRRTGITTSE